MGLNKELPMKNIFSITSVFLLVLAFNNYAIADDHTSDEAEVFNLQVQLCTLKGNTSIKQ